MELCVKVLIVQQEASGIKGLSKPVQNPHWAGAVREAVSVWNECGVESLSLITTASGNQAASPAPWQMDEQS